MDFESQICLQIYFQIHIFPDLYYGRSKPLHLRLSQSHIKHTHTQDPLNHHACCQYWRLSFQGTRSLSSRLNLAPRRPIVPFKTSTRVHRHSKPSPKGKTFSSKTFGWQHKLGLGCSLMASDVEEFAFNVSKNSPSSSQRMC